MLGFTNSEKIGIPFHEYTVNATPRDFAKMEGRRSIRDPMHQTITPRINPLTHELDRLNSTANSVLSYNPKLVVPNDLHIVPRRHAALSLEKFEATFRRDLALSGSFSAR